MDVCEDDGVKQASLQVQSQFFYEESNLNLIISLIKENKPRSKKYMECLVDCVQQIFDLIEANWSSEHGGIVTCRVRKSKNGISGDESEVDENAVFSHEKTYSLDRLHMVGKSY